MYGTRAEFDYLECSKCGTLSLQNVPDLSNYYPDDYYSFNDGPIDLEVSRKRLIAAWFIGRYLFTGRGRLGKYLAVAKPHITREFPPSLMEPVLGLTFNSRILDIGSGGGELLRKLEHIGFRSLTGADPYIEEDKIVGRRVAIRKAEPSELDGVYDLVMLHHSFEHMADPKDVLTQCHRLLTNDGTCLIRLPIVSHAWEVYGTDWVQLDPPRHLFLFTESGFRTLAEERGFEVAKVVYDSSAFQFYGSEQYKRDIHLNDKRTFLSFEDGGIFTSEQHEKWRIDAIKLNKEQRGDQACFYLKKIGSITSD